MPRLPFAAGAAGLHVGFRKSRLDPANERKPHHALAADKPNLGLRAVI
jgi:hypothetical protein